MKFVAILTLLVCSISFAAAPVVQKLDQKKLDALVISYTIAKNLKQKSELFESMNHHPICNPQTSCIDAACEKLGTFGCDSQSEIDAVASACRGVDGDCLSSVCTRLGSFGCDSMSEIQSAANVCKNVFDGRCMDVVCDHLGTFGCDSMSEVSEVGKLCTGRVDSDCIQSVCNRLGSFSCDSMSELQQVAKTCGGQQP